MSPINNVSARSKSLNESEESTFASAPKCGICAMPMLAGQRYTHHTCEARRALGEVTYISDKHWLSGEYLEYLRSAQWRRFRARMLRITGGKCEFCGVQAKSGMNVHHVTYERLGCEREDDVLVLCPPCHDEEHRLQDEERLFDARFKGWLRKRYPDGMSFYDERTLRMEFEQWLDGLADA
jgi:hypothetical protein